MPRITPERARQKQLMWEKHRYAFCRKCGRWFSWNNFIVEDVDGNLYHEACWKREQNEN